MDKSRKRSLTRVKSPASRKSGVNKSGRSRSKSAGQNVKKETKTRGRSKSKTRKESKTKSGARAKSKSPRPRGRSSSRSKASYKPQTQEYFPQTHEYFPLSKEPELFEPRKVNMVLKNLYQDNYTSDSIHENLIRRSISKEISQERNSVTSHYPNLVRESSVVKQQDGIVMNDVPVLVSNVKVTKITEKDKHLNAFSMLFQISKSIKAFLGLLFLPPFILLLHLACTKEQCTLSKFHIHQNLNLYFNMQSGLILLGFVALQILLSLLNIGKRVEGPLGISGRLIYQCNGLLGTFISAGIVAILWHYEFPVTIVYDKMLSLIVSAALFAYFLGIILFIKGGRVSVPELNPEGIDTSKLYQLFVGREINPLLFGRINVKTLLLRISLNSLVLMNMIGLLKAHEMRYELSHTLILSIGLSTFLIIDFFWFENSFPSTFEAMYEGTGCYLTLSYMLFPFFPTLIIKYIIQHKIDVPVYGLAVIVVFFFMGYFIYRSSNLQKAAFRKNPLNPALAHFETIPTSRGKKLLVAGWWGSVRHPNYLGTIIFHWAWASSAGYYHAIPYIFPLAISFILINRARRVDAYCSGRYHTAWEEYCNRVPYRIIPRLF